MKKILFRLKNFRYRLAPWANGDSGVLQLSYGDGGGLQVGDHGAAGPVPQQGGQDPQGEGQGQQVHQSLWKVQQ